MDEKKIRFLKYIMDGHMIKDDSRHEFGVEKDLQYRHEELDRVVDELYAEGYIEYDEYFVVLLTPKGEKYLSMSFR